MLKIAAQAALTKLDLEVRRRPTAKDIWTMAGSLERLSSQIDVPRSIVDIGAARGDWTRLAKRQFPDSRFLMIEPLIENLPALQKVCRAFPDVSYELAVAGKGSTSVAFNVTDDLDGSGMYGSGMTGTKLRNVRQITLDEVAMTHNLRGPFLVKFDTHGYELQIMEGASKVLDQTTAIIMECYLFQVSPTAQLFWDICKSMHHRGFRVAGLADPCRRPRDGMLWQVDLVFLRSDNKAFSYESYS